MTETCKFIIFFLLLTIYLKYWISYIIIWHLFNVRLVFKFHIWYLQQWYRDDVHNDGYNDIDGYLGDEHDEYNNGYKFCGGRYYSWRDGYKFLYDDYNSGYNLLVVNIIMDISLHVVNINPHIVDTILQAANTISHITNINTDVVNITFQVVNITPHMTNINSLVIRVRLLTF